MTTPASRLPPTETHSAVRDPDRLHLPIWYGDRWECWCGAVSTSDFAAEAHYGRTGTP